MCGRKRVNDGFAFVLIMPAAWTNALQFALENSARPALRKPLVEVFQERFHEPRLGLDRKEQFRVAPAPR